MSRRNNTGQTTTDLRERPRYSISESAKYIHVYPSTLRSWVAGRSYPRLDGNAHFEPLIQRSDTSDSRLSFSNLVEAHVLSALRKTHNVPMHAIRTAIAYAESDLGVERVLLDPRLQTSPGEILLETLDALINLGRAGQLAMKIILHSFLSRLDRDVHGVPLRFFPFIQPGMDAKTLVINPQVSFGRPILVSRGVSTETLADRVDAGEQVGDIAADYNLTPQEVEGAVIYERAA